MKLRCYHSYTVDGCVSAALFDELMSKMYQFLTRERGNFYKEVRKIKKGFIRSTKSKPLYDYLQEEFYYNHLFFLGCSPSLKHIMEKQDRNEFYLFNGKLYRYLTTYRWVDRPWTRERFLGSIKTQLKEHRFHPVKKEVHSSSLTLWYWLSKPFTKKEPEFKKYLRNRFLIIDTIESMFRKTPNEEQLILYAFAENALRLGRTRKYFFKFIKDEYINYRRFRPYFIFGRKALDKYKKMADELEKSGIKINNTTYLIKDFKPNLLIQYLLPKGDYIFYYKDESGYYRVYFYYGAGQPGTSFLDYVDIKNVEGEDYYYVYIDKTLPEFLRGY